MYGTIARLQLKPGFKEQLIKVTTEDNSAVIPGWVADYFFQSDSDPNECYLVAFFLDQESYTANADSPAQHERYLKLRACLESDPEWHDGQVICSTGPGAAR
jgi:heme-degrading monooxygenase HmoA